METGVIFLSLGFIIGMSFIANILFKRTNIPEPFILIIIGIVLGIFFDIDRSLLLALAPFLMGLVLIIILLDNGLEFNIFDTLRSMPYAILFTVVVLVLNIFAIGFLASVFLDIPLLYGMLIGTIIGGTTTDMVSILVKKIRLGNLTKSMLVIESVLNDLQLIVFFVILDLIKLGSVSVSSIISSILLQIPFALLLGTAFAVTWIYVMGRYIGKNPLNYAATVGVLFILYGVSNVIYGSGAISVLAFSLILGNWRRLMGAFGIPRSKFPQLTKKAIGTIKTVELDMSFFIKSIFFVFLGLLFNFKGVTAALILLSILAVVSMLAIRYASIRFINVFTNVYRRDVLPVTFIMPRGYIAAILVVLAMNTVVLPDGMLTFVLLNIFITTALSILYVFINGLQPARNN